jgi:predicted transcriptional regulator
MKISLSFKVNPRLKRALEKLAQKENRSLSNYVVTLLMRHLEEQDINWREEESGE